MLLCIGYLTGIDLVWMVKVVLAHPKLYCKQQGFSLESLAHMVPKRAVGERNVSVNPGDAFRLDILFVRDPKYSGRWLNFGGLNEGWF